MIKIKNKLLLIPSQITIITIIILSVIIVILSCITYLSFTRGFQQTHVAVIEQSNQIIGYKAYFSNRNPFDCDFIYEKKLNWDYIKNGNPLDLTDYYGQEVYYNFWGTVEVSSFETNKK